MSFSGSIRSILIRQLGPCAFRNISFCRCVASPTNPFRKILALIGRRRKRVEQTERVSIGEVDQIEDILSSLLISDMPKKLQSDWPNADVVKVLHSDEDAVVRIVMNIYGTEKMIQRQRSEVLLRSLERIKSNIINANEKLTKKAKKKLKKANAGVDDNAILQEASPRVVLYDQAGEKIDEETEVIEAWKRGTLLKICDVSYRVICNPPKVESVKLVRMPLVGMPIYPQLQLYKATIKHSRFEWYRRFSPTESDEVTEADPAVCVDDDAYKSAGAKRPKMDNPDAGLVCLSDEKHCGWEHIGCDIMYTPTEKDVGYLIKLKVTPGSEKYPVDADNGYVVKTVCATAEFSIAKGPERLLVEERLKHTVNNCENGSFRFVCYNILADVYANTEYAHNFLFPYCPTEAMDIDYRKQLILNELAGYNGDVICLQEVDRSVFESYYMPAMSLQGYAGAFAPKDGMKEGLALFYRREKYKVDLVDNIILRKSFKEERNADLRDKVSESDDLLKNFLHKPSCLLVILLESIEDRKRMLIGTTHLFWHPRGCHVRLIQVELLLREMRRLHAKHRREGETLTCVVAGDFNSNPHSGTVQLMTKGHVPSNHADWFSNGKAEYVGTELHNPTTFRSACGFPTYTNFVTSFQNCLDYIFIDDTLEVERVISQPSHEDVVRHTALPNETAPSDHIAQVVELAWKT